MIVRASSLSSNFGTDWETKSGLRVLLEESHALPLVDLELVIETGALADPVGKEGLTRLAARLMRMGTKRRSSSEVDGAIDGMGASLSIDIGYGAMRVHGSVIRRNLEPFLLLLGELVTTPALREEDFGIVQREALADFGAARDNDRWLAGRAFRSQLFGSHPYARMASGSERTIERIGRSDVRRFIEANFLSRNMLLGFAGDVDRGSLQPMVEKAFANLRPGAPSRSSLPEVEVERPGRRLVIVDKPERTQTQIYLGSLGIELRSPDFYPLQVANSAFGGTFSSRLVQEVRDKRGWSYSANARLGADEQRDAWSLYSHPSAENAVDCIALELQLVEQFVAEGPTAAELTASRDHLIKSHAFDRDTATKRLEPRIDALVHGMPESFYRDYTGHVRGVKLTSARKAVKTHLSPRDQVIAVVATARDIRSKLERLPDLVAVEQVAWTDV